MLRCTPGLVGSLALAVSALIEIVGASSRNAGTTVGSSAPCESWQQSQTLAAVVVGGATAGSLDALLLGSAKSVTRGRADTVSATIAIIGTGSNRQVHARSSGIAPRSVSFKR